MSRPVRLAFVAVIVLSAAALWVFAAPTPDRTFVMPSEPPIVHVSVLCQMTYRDIVMPGAVNAYMVDAPLSWSGCRLGPILFAPGDIILQISGQEVIPGPSLDNLIRMAELENRRTITLIEGASGRTVTREF
jgi:hypothetical protein